MDDERGDATEEVEVREADRVSTGWLGQMLFLIPQNNVKATNVAVECDKMNKSQGLGKFTGMLLFWGLTSLLLQHSCDRSLPCSKKPAGYLQLQNFVTIRQEVSELSILV